MKNAILIVLVTLVFISAITFLYERFLSMASNSAVTIAGVLIMIVLIFLYGIFLFRQFKNPLK